jgi:uncharacterized protein YndB with AHSA1/START domain
MSDKDREIDVLIRARYPFLYIVSHEEARVEDAVRRIVNGKKQVLTWSATEPFSAVDSQARIALDGVSQALEALNFALKKVREENTRTVFILRDFDPYMEQPVIERRCATGARAQALLSRR